MSKLEQQQALPRGGIFDRVTSVSTVTPRIVTSTNVTALKRRVAEAKPKGRAAYMRDYRAKKAKAG